MSTAKPCRIDAHVHFWQVARGDYPWMSADQPRLYRDYGPADLMPHLKASGIDGVILIQAAPSPAETDYLLELARQTSCVVGVIGWIDLESEQVSAELARLKNHSCFKGVRPMLQDLADPDWILGTAPARGLAALTEADCIFEWLVNPMHLDQALEILRRHPGLRTIINHAAKPAIGKGEFDAWARKMARLARNTRTRCKVSGLISEAGPDWSAAMLKPYFEHLLAEFGSDRLIFGSDWPVLNQASAYQTWLECLDELLANLDSTAKNRIFGLNAIEFYGLNAATLHRKQKRHSQSGSNDSETQPVQ